MISEIEWLPLITSMKLAAVTTVILLFIGIPVALMLAYTDFRGKVAAEIVVTLPMFLPPTVIGFYLLVLFAPSSGLGKLAGELFGVELLFSFTGIVTASVIHSMPYMIQPLRDGLVSLGRSMLEASFTLGKSRISTLMHVMLPNIKTSLLTGVMMTFVHVMGEFGIVLMIGGSVPGETRVASIALYEKVEMMNYAEANIYAGILVSVSMAMLLIIYKIRNSKREAL
jgi:molybdate transport system permease protein